MKKFYSFFMMAIAIFAVSFTAKAATITLNVDDAERVEVQVNYEQVTIQSGVDTQFEIEDYASIYIVAKDGNFLKSVTRRNSYAEQVYNMSSCSLYCQSAADYDGVIWDVVSCNADEARDAEVTVTVDEAANVSLQRSNTYSYVNLVDGENKVKFMSKDEVPLTFSHNSWGKRLYKVTLNGVDVEAVGSYFNVTPQNGDKIEVTSNYPDVDVPVKITYGEGAEGFITSVSVDGTPVTNYLDENFTVKLGSTVAIYGDRQNYMFESIVVNDGEPYTTSYFYSYEFIVEENEYNIVVNAHKYGTIKAFVTVDNTANVTVYRGYSSANDVIALESGVKTEVELSENNPCISWVAASGSYVETVTMVTADGTQDKSGSSSINNIPEGAEITITTGIIERNYTAVLWIDDISLADYGGSFYGSYDRYLHQFNQLSSGYNVIEFGNIDNPFYFSTYSSTVSSPVVYQNEILAENKYGGYTLTLADKDVVKVFLATAEPATYNVTFELTGDIPAVTCTKDMICEVADWATGFSAMQGSQVDLAIDGSVSVSVNDTPIEYLDADGKYSFNVDADALVKISATNSIENVVVSEIATDNNVYNLQGICVAKNATAEQIKSLPAGMYIINGKKVIK